MEKIFLLSFFSIVLLLSCSQKKHHKIKIQKNNIEERLIENIDLKNEKTAKELNDFSINVIDSFSGLISNKINALIQNDNYLWLCSDTGISKINNTSGKIINIYFTNGYLKNFFSYSDTCFLISSMGLYILTNNNISLISNISLKKDFVKIDNSRIMLSSESGNLYYFNMKNLTLTKTFTNLRGVQKITGQENTFFISLNDRLIKLQGTTVETIISNYKNKYDLYYFNDDALFLTGESLIEISLDNNRKNFLLTLNTNEVITYLAKNNNVLYIGKNKGLLYYNLATKQLIPLLNDYKIKNSYITYILTAENNTLLLGTKNNGLIKYMFNSNKLTIR